MQVDRTRRGWRPATTILLLAGATFVAALATLRHWNGDESLSSDLKEMFDSDGKLRPVSEIAKMVVASKLIAVELETTVRSTSEDVIWRGAARAEIEAPVKLGYGVELEATDAKALDLWAGARWLFVTAPPPRLLTVEPQLDRMEERIDVTGTRTRSRAGDTQRQLAMRRLEQQARRMVLSPEQRREVEDKTRAQLEKLLSGLVSNRYAVRVTFASE